MKIKKKINSNISKIDFNNLEFGRYYSDHMLYCSFKNNKWNNPIIIPFNKIKLFPTCLAFHYGQAVFEGMKAYKDKNNNIFLFRPEENFKRINKSAERLEMPKIPKNFFIKGLKKLINIDKDWIPNFYGESLYLRPFMIANGNILMAKPSEEYIFIIISTPCGSYYNKKLKVKIEEKYSRACNGGIGNIKAAGNYASSFFPTKLAEKQGYDQILWTDSSTHKIIEESGTMNIFFYFENKLITPAINNNILEGITRKSIISIAKKEGIEVEEREITVKEIIKKLKNNIIKEAFGCGTAVVTNSFKFIGYKGFDFKLPNLSYKESIAIKLRKKLLDIQHNLSEDLFKWRFKINNI